MSSGSAFSALVEIGATQEIAAGAADELAARVFKTRAAGGAESTVVFLTYELAYGFDRAGRCIYIRFYRHICESNLTGHTHSLA